MIYFPSEGHVVQELCATGERCRVIEMTPLQNGWRHYPTYASDLFRATRRLRRVLKADKVDLVYQGQPEVLAKALAELIMNQAKAQRFGQAGRRRVEREFTAQVHAERIQTLYAELFRQA